MNHKHLSLFSLLLVLFAMFIGVYFSLYHREAVLALLDASSFQRIITGVFFVFSFLQLVKLMFFSKEMSFFTKFITFIAMVTVFILALFWQDMMIYFQTSMNTLA